MKVSARIAAVLASAALGVVPALALAKGPGSNSGTTTTTASTTDPGKACQGESKKHVKGQKGTPFSQCVTAMAHLQNGTAKTAKEACKGLSKKHVSGMKGTPYSECIVAAAQLHKKT